jgi:hypothetical protein
MPLNKKLIVLRLFWKLSSKQDKDPYKKLTNPDLEHWEKVSNINGSGRREITERREFCE